MDIFLRSISGILVILGMILVGFVIGEKGWFDDKSRGLTRKIGHSSCSSLLYALHHHTALYGGSPPKNVASLAVSCPVYGHFTWHRDRSSKDLCSEAGPPWPLYFHVF